MTHPIDAIYDIDDLVRRFNALPDGRRFAALYGKPKYDRWKVRRILEAAGVDLFQERKGAKLYTTHKALERALGGDLINSLLDVEALDASIAA